MHNSYIQPFLSIYKSKIHQRLISFLSYILFCMLVVVIWVCVAPFWKTEWKSHFPSAFSTQNPLCILLQCMLTPCHARHKLVSLTRLSTAQHHLVCRLFLITQMSSPVSEWWQCSPLPMCYVSKPFFPAGKSTLTTSANLFPPSTHLYSEMSIEMMTTFRLLCQDIPGHHTVRCCPAVFPYYPPVSICCVFIYPWGRNSIGCKPFLLLCAQCLQSGLLGTVLRQIMEFLSWKIFLFHGCKVGNLRRWGAE